MKAIFDIVAFEKDVLLFAEKAKIAFSCGGGTTRVLAGAAHRFYAERGVKVPYGVLVGAVDRVAPKCSGFYAGAMFECGRGDAYGFARYLERKAKKGGVGA